MTQRTERRAFAPGPRRTSSPGHGAGTLSVGFAILSLLPLGGAVFLLDRSRAVSREVLFGSEGLIVVLMLASAGAAFALIRNELRRTLSSILDEAHRRAAFDRRRVEPGDPIQEVSESIGALRAEIAAIREIPPVAPWTDPYAEEPPAPASRVDLVRVGETLLRRQGRGALEPVLREVLGAVRANAAYVTTPDERRGEFVTVAAVGAGAEALAGQRVPLGEGVPAAAVRERTALLVSNPERPGADAEHDVMAVPLLDGETVLGVLVVQDPASGQPFGTRDLEDLSGLCRLVAAALAQSAAADGRRRSDDDTVDEILRMFAREIDERNPYTRGHSERVARYCEEMAKALRLDESSVRLVRRAALLHDIGKLLLPESIVRKEDRLNDDELELMRTHVVRAEKMVQRIPGFEELAPIVRHHHERFDGSGYPDGLAGSALSLETHLLIVANAFDVMTSDRSYRQAASLLQALRVLQEEAGTRYHRRAVQALCGLDREILTAPTDVPVSVGSTVKGQGSASISIME